MSDLLVQQKNWMIFKRILIDKIEFPKEVGLFWKFFDLQELQRISEKGSALLSLLRMCSNLEPFSLTVKKYTLRDTDSRRAFMSCVGTCMYEYETYIPQFLNKTIYRCQNHLTSWTSFGNSLTTLNPIIS